MKPGDLVHHHRDGARGTFLRLENNGKRFVVDCDGEEVHWHRSTCSPVAVTHAPKGVARAGVRQLEAARLLAEGMTAGEVAQRFNVHVNTVHKWREIVVAAVKDARNLAALRSGT